MNYFGAGGAEVLGCSSSEPEVAEFRSTSVRVPDFLSTFLGDEGGELIVKLVYEKRALLP